MNSAPNNTPRSSRKPAKEVGEFMQQQVDENEGFAAGELVLAQQIAQLREELKEEQATSVAFAEGVVASFNTMCGVVEEHVGEIVADTQAIDDAFLELKEDVDVVARVSLVLGVLSLVVAGIALVRGRGQ